MKIVIIDDESGNLEYTKRIFRKYQTIGFSSPEKALKYVETNSFDIVISDQKMPGISGIECIQKIQNISKDFIGIIISAHVDSHDLIDAVNSNIIYKYILKPFTPDQLLQTIYRAEEVLDSQRKEKKQENELKLMNARLLSENKILKEKSSSSLDSFIGYHPLILKLKEKAVIYAGSDQPVLITGETGTGKELMARAIHLISARSGNQFLAVNCSAISEHLLESELFGHEKGSFTGAIGKKKGLLKTADKGTLFLDEIGDFPFSLQAKVLRVVQFGTFYPVGSNVEEKVDVRILSATNVNLLQAIDKEKFRKDFYYRINSLHLDIPPLRERTDDILHIMDAIVAQSDIILPILSEKARKTIREYNFPGNVRELENFVEKLNLYCKAHKPLEISESVVLDFLEEDLRMYNKNPEEPQNQQMEDIDDIPLRNQTSVINLQQYLSKEESSIINKYLNDYKWNISKTARALSLSRQGLKNKIKRYKLRVSSGDDEKKD